MHRNLFVLIAALALTLAVGGSSLAGTHGSDPGTGQGQGRGQGQGQGPPEGAPGQGHGSSENQTDENHTRPSQEVGRQGRQGLSEQRRAAAMERAEQAGLFARFTADNGTAQGRFISFAYDDENGTIHDYTYHASNETRFFDNVSISPYTKTHNATARGAAFFIRGDNATLRAHNNPVGLLHANAHNSSRTITFGLADNVTIASTDNRSLALEAGDLQARMILLGNGTTHSSDNTTITIQTTEDGGGALFQVRPDRPTARSAHMEHRLEALKEGRLGAEMSVVSVNGTLVEDTSDYGVSMNAAQAGNGTLTVRAESAEHRGRVVVLEVHRDVFGVQNAQDVLVLLDGEAALRVATAQEILATDPGEQATYHVEQVDDVYAVTFGIPHFSEREIILSAAQDEDEAGSDEDGTRGTPIVGIGILLSVLGAVAAVAGLRRVKKD